jgi:hypothetical protein
LIIPIFKYANFRSIFVQQLDSNHQRTMPASVVNKAEQEQPPVVNGKWLPLAIVGGIIDF